MDTINLYTFNGIDLFDEPIEKIIATIKDKKIPDISYIVTPNVDHFYRLDQNINTEFVDAYSAADIRICDSRIIRLITKLKSDSIRNVTPGSDLTKIILESDWCKNLNLLLIGPGSKDVEAIKNKFKIPHLQHYTPPMGFINDTHQVSKCVEIIRAAQADIVFLAVGSPQQELLAYRVKKAASGKFPRGTVMLCIGASFDFLSGRINRAPIFIQRLHLEWLHRALSDPVRLLPRYWKNLRWLISYVLKNNSGRTKL